MKYIIGIFLSLILFSAKAQFTGTDSLRNYNNRYTTNNPATAFTNLRLNTLLRGIIDWVDTARAGTGGGGALGIDTLWALNDSTIRYRKSGVFRNTIVRGVYDARRKVDTVYKVNDTTIGFKINGAVRTIIIPGRSGMNLANAALTANGDYTQNWGNHILKFDTTNYTEFNSYRPDPLLVAGNIFTSKFYLDSTVNGRPFSLRWALRNGANDGDSIRGVLETNESTTTILNAGDNNNQFGNWQFIGNSNNPRLTGSLVSGVESSNYSFGRVATLNPNDSIRLKLESASATAKIMGVRAESSGLWTPVAIDIPTVGSATLSNVGSGYRLVKTADGQIKTLFFGYGINGDSTTNTNAITLQADTSELVTPSDLADAISGVTSGINQLTSDVTAGPGSGSQAATIAANAVTNPKFRQSAGLSVVGTAGSSTANVADITAGTDNQVLRRSGSALGFGAVNINSDNAVTGLLKNANIDSFYTYPAQSTLGRIWYDSAFTDLSDFIPTGGPSISLSSGTVSVVNTAIADDANVAIKKYRVTNLSNWTFRSQAQAIRRGIGFGPGLVSLYSGDNTGFHITQFTGSTTLQVRRTSSGAVLVSGTGPAIADNDVVEFTIIRADTLLTVKVRNVTTSSATTTLNFSYDLAYVGGSPVVTPNDCYFAYTSFNDDFKILSAEFSSDEIKNPAGLYLADSKGNYYAGTTAARTGNILNATYPNVVSMSSPGGTLASLYSRLDEIYQLNPEWIIGVDFGRNDRKLFSTSEAEVKRMLTDIAYKLSRNGSTKFQFFFIPEDTTAGGSTQGLTALKQWVATQPFGLLQNAVWDSLSTSNVLKAAYDPGDQIHINAAAHAKIASIIIASGMFTGKNPKDRTPYIKGDDNIVMTGNVPHLAYEVKRVPNYVMKADTLGNLTNSIMHDDGNAVVFSKNYSEHLNPTSGLAQTRAIFDGAAYTTGIDGFIGLRDRTTTDISGFIMNDGVTQLLMNGTDLFHWTTSGFYNIGVNPAGRARGIFNIWKDRTFAITQSTKGLGINLDSNTYTLSATTTIDKINNVSLFPNALAATGATTFTNPSTLYIGGAPYAGTNGTITTPWSLRVDGGNSYFAGFIYNTGADSAGSPKNMAWIDTDGKLRKAAAPSSAAITSVNSMTGPAITITAGTGITTSSGSNDVAIAVDVNNSALPHTIDKQFIDANNTGTGETDLYTKSVAGNTLNSNGQSLAFEVGGVFNDATATANLQLYFAGTAFGGTGAMTLTGTGAWRAQGSVVRVSSSVYRATVTFFSDNTSQKIFTSMANVTSVDFTTSNTFKITGTAGGAGGGSNDITAQAWIVRYDP